MNNKKWPDLRCPKCMRRTTLNKIYKDKTIYVCKNENCIKSTYHAHGVDWIEYDNANQIETKILTKINDLNNKLMDLQIEALNIENLINFVKNVPNLQFEKLKLKLKEL
jgi:hypothetical protein